MGYAQLADYFIGSEIEQVLSFKSHPGALICRNHAGNGLQRCAFTGAIGTDNTNDLAFVDFEIQPVQGLNIAIGNA